MVTRRRLGLLPGLPSTISDGPTQSLGDRAPIAVWRAGVTSELDGTAVDMTLRLDSAIALPTYPQPQQQPRAARPSHADTG
jgi:hypothetical protein